MQTSPIPKETRLWRELQAQQHAAAEEFTQFAAPHAKIRDEKIAEAKREFELATKTKMEELNERIKPATKAWMDEYTKP